MMRCSRCTTGRVIDDNGRRVCLNCGQVYADPVDVLERIIGNALPESEPHCGPRQIQDLGAIRDRITAVIARGLP